MVKKYTTPLFVVLFNLVAATVVSASVPTVVPQTVPTTLETAPPQGPRGSVKGTVIDSQTGEPLIGTTVLVEGTTLGTVTDAEGSFTISNIVPGTISIIAQYLGYEIYRQDVFIEGGKQIDVRISLSSQGINVGDVVVIAQIDHESESVLLSEQKDAVVATQAVGAFEMSRKGIGNAQAAVAQVSGISQQDGVKNVFVRGLGDRYNATYLNGFPLPSEDPEYKNIALDFFGTDVIQNIGVNKVFSAHNNGDVGGAVIDINTKELYGKNALSVGVDGGINTGITGVEFKKTDGVNYLGVSNTALPTDGKFDFVNSLDPKVIKAPVNHSYGLSGGYRFDLGPNKHPLSFFVVANHSTNFSHTTETIRNSEMSDNIYMDMTGERSSISISQLVLANLDFRLDTRHAMAYNFMLIHANEQYVGEFTGLDGDKYMDSFNPSGEQAYQGFRKRQQSNDNLLMVHQLSTKWALHERVELRVGAAYNTITGTEPDRRENNLSLKPDGTYKLTGGNGRQKRFFSELTETDLSAKADVRVMLSRRHGMDRSNVTFGYRGRIVKDNFWASEYTYKIYNTSIASTGVEMDEIYNNTILEAGTFSMETPIKNSYRVNKSIHSGYVEATHQLARKLIGNVGFQVDHVDLDVTGVKDEMRELKKLYYLPSLSLRWDIANKNSLRLGASQSYTLPQSKEMSNFLYTNISYSSQGNLKVNPSDDYNIDLKWDYYLTSNELISLGAFYKYISNPIGRVNKDGGTALVLTYYNISEKADVAGIEFEMRKNIFNKSIGRGRFNRLSFGVSASYIYSAMQFDDDENKKTPAARKTQLEGASPFLINGDLSYNYTSGETSITASLVVNYFSDRVYTLGTAGYNDIVEKGTPTLSLVSSFKINKHLTLKLKAGNLLNQPYRLARKYFTKSGEVIISEYRKGIDIGLGISFDL